MKRSLFLVLTFSFSLPASAAELVRTNGKVLIRTQSGEKAVHSQQKLQSHNRVLTYREANAELLFQNARLELAPLSGVQLRQKKLR